MTRRTATTLRAAPDRRAGGPADRPPRRAFTLIELLVVISIILITLAAILPAFGRLIESQNYTSAINSVTATLGNARALAVTTRRRTGVVFLWNERTERMSLQVVQFLHEGSLDRSVGFAQGGANCEAFAPAPNTVPVELPARVGVFGLSFGIDTDPVSPTTPGWYEDELLNAADLDLTNDIIPWLFPRNDPRIFTIKSTRSDLGVDPWEALRGIDTDPTLPDDEAVVAVRNATSFFVMFDESGTVSGSRRSGRSDIFDAYLEYPQSPVDSSAVGAAPYDDDTVFDPEFFGQPPVDPDSREANPEVRLRAAVQFAVVDLARMAEGLGYPRPWLTRFRGSSNVPQPAWLDEREYFDNDRMRDVSRWIDLNAEILSFNRFSGNVIRRSPR